MTRIIAGTAGGRRIKTPSGDSTRPTSDRVREALFSAVDSALGSVHGLRFLDVYAGSGAVGLEARSRGAGVVTLVEHDRRTAALIGQNARTLGFTGIDVLAVPVGPGVRASAARAVRHRLPGPALRRARHRTSSPCSRRCATRGGSRPTRSSSSSAPAAAPTCPGRQGFSGDRTRKYGETTLWYGRATA